MGSGEYWEQMERDEIVESDNCIMNTSASTHSQDGSYLSSPNKFSAHRQARRADLSPSRPTQAHSYQYSSQFMEEIDVISPQKQHSNAISLYQDRLKRQEESSEKIIEALKGQIGLLRKQLDTAEATHRKELDTALKQGETTAQKLQVMVQNLETQITVLSQSNASIHQKSLDQEHLLKSHYERELSQLRFEVQSAKSELDDIHINRSSLSHSEAQRLIDRNQELSEQHRADLEAVRRLQVELASCRRDVDVKDKAIGELRGEVNVLKEECELAGEDKEMEMRRVQMEFANLQKSMEAQQSDFQRVSAAQSHWEEEWEGWRQEQSLHEHERKRLKRENRDLQLQVARLEKLVYGKGSLRSTPSPIRSRTPLT